MEKSSGEDSLAAPGDQQQHQLQALPSDALSSILEHCPDIQSILNLGQTSDKLREAIYHQKWKCKNCRDPIFVASDLSSARFANPFMCGVCRAKLCGQSVDYDKRLCRPQKCDGCGKVECHSCMSAHMGNEDGYGTENYCEACQAEFEFGMGGC